MARTSSPRPPAPPLPTGGFQHAARSPEEGGQGRRAGELTKDRGTASGSLMPDRKGQVHVSTRPAHTEGRGYEGDTGNKDRRGDPRGCRPQGNPQRHLRIISQTWIGRTSTCSESEGNPLKSRHSLRSQQGGGGARHSLQTGRRGDSTQEARGPAAGFQWLKEKDQLGSTHACTHMHTHVDVHMHTCVIDPSTHVQVHMHTYVRVFMCTQIHMHTHTHMQRNTHAHICINTHQIAFSSVAWGSGVVSVLDQAAVAVPHPTGSLANMPTTQQAKKEM